MKDSFYNMNLNKYIDLISNYGFELILKDPIIKDNKTIEYFYTYWHDDLGILLLFDTYNGNVNGGRFYYNYFVKLAKYGLSVESGGFYKKNKDLVYFDEKMNIVLVKEYIGYNLTKTQLKHNDEIYHNFFNIWIGYHDCRESILSKIKKLNKNGVLLSKWIEPDSCLYLASGYEYCTKNMKDISLKRLKILPENIKEKICYKKILKKHQQ